MPQHPFTINNLTAPQVRAQINLALQALASVSSGSTQPPVTFAGMFWLDTSPATPVLRVRNAANNGWIEVGELTAAGMNIGGRVPQVVSATAPANPTPGMQWIDTSQSPAVVRVRNGGNTGWITIAPLPDVLLRDGSQPMTGRLHLAAGASGGLGFAGDTETGLVRDAANTLRLRTNSGNRMTLTNTGIEAHVALTVPAATAAWHAMRWDQREAEVFHIATITSPVQSVVVPLPPVPYAVAVEWHEMRIDPAVTVAANRFFGADYSTDNQTTWVTHGWSRYYANAFNSTGASAWNTNEVAWAFTFLTDYGGGHESSGTLWLSRIGTHNRPNHGHYVCVATYSSAGSLNTIGGHGIVGPNPVPHPNEPPITHLRFRWRGNLTMVSGVVRVLAKRLS